MLSEPPDDLGDRIVWRREAEETFADKVRRRLTQIIVGAYETYLGTLTAAGDLSAFDSIPQQWGVYVLDELTDDLDQMYKAGAITAWNTAPTTTTLPASAATGWAQIIAEDAIQYQAQATNRLVGVGDDIWRKVNSQVTDALQKGASTEDLKKGIEQITQFSEFRADTIARTEMNAAFVNGAYEGEVALGEHGPVWKEWLPVGDSRMRPEHEAMMGQPPIPFGEDFIVGDEPMAHPMADGASAGNVVNCRCDVLFYYPGDTLPDGTLVEAPATMSQNAEVEEVLSTEDRFLDRSSGKPQWMPERVASVHDPFITSLLSQGVRQDQPIVTFMGGGSGAGKGSLQKKGLIKPREGTVVIDSDKAKLGIPEYNEMLSREDLRAATVVHEESSFMAARAMAASIESGFDTVLDGTGNSSIEKLSAKVADARARGGKRLVAEYVTIDTDEAIRRATQRAANSGREVPKSVITGTHESVSSIFPQIVDQNLFDELRLWDNMGDTPELIFEMKDGAAQVINPERFDAFLRKSPLHPDYVPV